MMSKIYQFLFKSYHRPSAKILHFLALLQSLFFNKKSKAISEKFMLLKNPPSSTIFYNFFGRIFILIANFIFIIFFNKYFESDVFIDNYKNKKKNNENGRDSSPWPTQAIHFFENLKEVNEKSFIQIQENYKLSLESLEKNKYFKDSPWWIECRKEFKKIFINNDGSLNQNEFVNFRNSKQTKAALLADQNFLKGEVDTRINKLKSLSLINLFHKLSEIVDVNVLRASSESYSGNSLCLNYRGQRLNHRILRYAYYTSQILNNTNFSSKAKTIILDLGGGYGGLSRMLYNHLNNTIPIIIEIPEVCAFAHYFLKNNYPDKKIGTFKDFLNLEKIDDTQVMNYDFVILPQTCIEKINDKIIDLSINTTSLGEMSNEVQDYYISQLERITKKYLYSVNRAKTRKDKYDAKGFYDLNFNSRWKSIIYKFSHTYHIEFLGKKND